jgi:hypothetical protein
LGFSTQPSVLSCQKAFLPLAHPAIDNDFGTDDERGFTGGKMEHRSRRRALT